MGRVRVRLLIELAVLAAVIVAYLAVREYHIFTATRRAAQRQATITALHQFQRYLDAYCSLHGEFPKPPLREAMNAIEREARQIAGNETIEYHKSAFISRPGLDGWGHEFIYEVLDSEHAIIRSIGPDGIDDRGMGDDIQLKIPHASSHEFEPHSSNGRLIPPTPNVRHSLNPEQQEFWNTRITQALGRGVPMNREALQELWNLLNTHVHAQ